MKTALLAAGLMFAGPALGSEFLFDDFAVTKDLNLIRDAYRTGKIVRLTDANKFQAGAIWHKQKQSVTAGFETTFTFVSPTRTEGATRAPTGWLS